MGVRIKKKIYFLLLVLLFLFTQASFAGVVTVIAHGNGDDSGITGGWLQQMANMVAYRAGGDSSVVTLLARILWNGDRDNPILDVVTAQKSGPSLWSSEHNGNVVVILDWSECANAPLGGASTLLVAQKVANILTNTTFGGKLLIEQPLHLVGHSRGASLMAYLSGYLGQYGGGLWVDHLTTLDFVAWFGDYENADIYQNVLFADNYRQSLGVAGNPMGLIMPDAFERNLTDLNNGYYLPHNSVHLWYHGTIDHFVPCTDGEVIMDQSMRSTWYTAYEKQGVSAGYLYSRIGGGDRLSDDQPDGADRISDGYHSGFTLAGESGHGARTLLDKSNAVWPNVVEVKLAANGQILKDSSANIPYGTTVNVNYAYEDCDSPVTVYIGFDQDQNPYNSNGGHFAVISNPATHNPLCDTYQWNTAATSHGDSGYVYVAVFDGVRTRYMYAKSKLNFEPKPNNPPVISNVRAQQREGTKLVDVYYDLEDAENDLADVSLTGYYMDSNYNFYSIDFRNMTGDFGSFTTCGLDNHIIWDAGADWDNKYDSSVGITITAIAAGVPKNGDPNAVYWEVVAENSWVKNIYANGNITLSDGQEMWPYDASIFGKMNFYAATNYCENLSYSGYSNWQLPPIPQMFNDIYRDKAYFINVQNDYYWSAQDFDGRVDVCHMGTNLKPSALKTFQAWVWPFRYHQHTSSSGASFPVDTREKIPPANVSDFRAKASESAVDLTWLNPVDSDFAEVKILRKTGSYPANESDGTVVYTNNGTQFTDTGLTGGVEYFYKAFTCDVTGNYSSGTVTSATPYDIPIHYVSPSGSNTWPYADWDTAANDIQSAVDAASAGDTVLVADGYYGISSQISIVKGINVQSTSGAKLTIVDAAKQSRAFVLGVSNCVLSGFTISNGKAVGMGGGIYCSNINATVSNCVITGNEATTRGGGMNGGRAYNCLFIGNQAGQFGGAMNGGRAYNCTMADNEASIGNGGVHGSQLYNSIVFFNVPNNSTNSPVVRNSCSPDIVSGTYGNIAVEPEFIDHGNGDYRLTPWSPCLNSGSAAYASGGADLDGKPRVSFGSVDMGAYEFSDYDTADLVIENVVYNSEIYRIGGAFGVTATEANWGSIAITNPFLIQAVLSPSRDWDDSNNVRIFESTEMEGLDSGEFFETNITVVITDIFPVGDHYLGIRIDVANEVDELWNEVNNTWWSEEANIRIRNALPPDSDNDGIPDLWEQMYFGNSTNADPNTVCSNGVNTIHQAYIVGINPNDPQSAFLTSVLSGRILQWGAVSGRVYSVYWTSNLLSGFQCLESNIPWTRSDFTNTPAVPSGYYKIDVRLE